MSAAAAPVRFHLTDAQRSILLDLIATHPGDTIEGIRLRFAERTGRPVGAETVRVAWVRGYQVLAPGDRHRRLTGAERVTLERLCLSTPRTYGSVPAIALRFFEATGRGVNARTVRHYRRRLFTQRSEGERTAIPLALGMTSPTQQ